MEIRKEGTSSSIEEARAFINRQLEAGPRVHIPLRELAGMGVSHPDDLRQVRDLFRQEGRDAYLTPSWFRIL